MESAQSKGMTWTGRVLSGLVILFLTFDGVMKFFLHLLPPEALADSEKLQFPMETMPVVGTILLVCTLLYVIPRTTILGAVLLTGYLGGAVAVHLRVGNPLATHLLFPVYIGILLWLGLYLRFPQVRSMMPLFNKVQK